jgi:hypothetical protein
VNIKGSNKDETKHNLVKFPQLQENTKGETSTSPTKNTEGSADTGNFYQQVDSMHIP